MRTSFVTKSDARDAVWDTLEDMGVARFPFPPHGRIPNFEGAKHAAEQLFDTSLLSDAEVIKVNPDAPQRYVRIEALRRECTVYVPTPRLRGGFKMLDPSTIPEEDVSSAASLSHMDEWAKPIELNDLPSLDVIVSGSVAVTRDGHRCGKGEGYSDLEYAILRELGHDPVPVATTVHPLQVVDEFPTDEHDVPLSVIVTPEDVTIVSNPHPAPDGIHWDDLPEAACEEMPVLAELRQRTNL